MSLSPSRTMSGLAGQAVTDRNWYASSAEEVAATLDIDPAAGLPAARARELLSANGPNSLPEEKPRPGWRRFLAQYTSYMQLILVAAAIVSLAIKQWATAVVLLLLTLLNAVVGMRQEGKAESAMNALKSMMKATARVRRDGAESVIPAEDLVVGDIVLIAAGDEVPADGRIIAASALQIDESALTSEMNRLTLWIASAAGLTMVVMFALGRARGRAWDELFTAAVSLAIAAIPEALPTVAQWILSVGGVDLAKRNAIVKDLPSVETLGFTSAINSDKTGTLTLNQMTALEVVSPANRFTISGIGYGLDGEVLHPVGAAAR